MRTFLIRDGNKEPEIPVCILNLFYDRRPLFVKTYLWIFLLASSSNIILTVFYQSPNHSLGHNWLFTTKKLTII